MASRAEIAVLSDNGVADVGVVGGVAVGEDDAVLGRACADMTVRADESHGPDERVRADVGMWADVCGPADHAVGFDDCPGCHIHVSFEDGGGVDSAKDKIPEWILLLFQDVQDECEISLAGRKETSRPGRLR